MVKEENSRRKQVSDSFVLEIEALQGPSIQHSKFQFNLQEWLSRGGCAEVSRTVREHEVITQPHPRVRSWQHAILQIQHQKSKSCKVNSEQWVFHRLSRTGPKMDCWWMAVLSAKLGSKKNSLFHSHFSFLPSKSHFWNFPSCCLTVNGGVR